MLVMINKVVIAARGLTPGGASSSYTHIGLSCVPLDCLELRV